MVLRPKRRKLPGYILQFICTMDQEYPTIGGPRVGNAATGMNRLKLLSFILALWMTLSFLRKSKLNLFLPRKAFSSPCSYLSPLNFPTFSSYSLSLYIPSLEWVSIHEGSLGPGIWGPFNILEMTPLELARASKFEFGRWISPRHYIMPLTISCGDRFGLSSVRAFHRCSV